LLINLVIEGVCGHFVCTLVLKSLFAVDDLITPYPQKGVNPQSELFSSFLQILAFAPRMGVAQVAT